MLLAFFSFCNQLPPQKIPKIFIIQVQFHFKWTNMYNRRNQLKKKKKQAGVSLEWITNY
jgi:hypothetical protein